MTYPSRQGKSFDFFRDLVTPAQKKSGVKIHELILDGLNEALSSEQDNEQTNRILMIFRFNALVMMSLDLSPALIDAMEKGIKDLLVSFTL